MAERDRPDVRVVPLLCVCGRRASFEVVQFYDGEGQTYGDRASVGVYCRRCADAEVVYWRRDSL